jgi:hypothetical protein
MNTSKWIYLVYDNVATTQNMVEHKVPWKCLTKCYFSGAYIVLFPKNTNIAWDNALSWSWENAMSALQETLYKVSVNRDLSECLIDYQEDDCWNNWDTLYNVSILVYIEYFYCSNYITIFF